MARARKVTLPALKETEQKVAGLKAINKTLDLGKGVSVAAGEALLAGVRNKLEEYNTLLALADAKLNEVNAENKNLRGFNSKVLPAVGLEYGKDSHEYEMVGGVRESERKKPVRKKNEENK